MLQMLFRAHHQKLGSRVKRENTSAKQKLYRPLWWRPTVFNFKARARPWMGGRQTAQAAPLALVSFASIQSTTFRNCGCSNPRDCCSFPLVGGLSPHCKHRCSSSFPGDMLRLVRSATQANGIYFCLRHVQPAICNLLSHAVSFQWRVHAVCQDTKVAKKKSGKSCLIKVWIWRRKCCMSKVVHPEASLNHWTLNLLCS